jgi:hypothetical protein
MNKTLHWREQILQNVNAINILKSEAIYRWIKQLLSSIDNYESKNLILTSCIIVEKDNVRLPDNAPFIGDYIRDHGESSTAISSLVGAIDNTLYYLHNRYKLLKIVERNDDYFGGFSLKIEEASLLHIDPQLDSRLQLFRRWSVGTDPERFRLDKVYKDLHQLESFCGFALADHPEILLMDRSAPSEERYIPLPTEK